MFTQMNVQVNHEGSGSEDEAEGPINPMQMMQNILGNMNVQTM
jgi:hypothetical protein